MPTVILDTIENSRYEDSVLGGQIITRGALVKDIDFAPGESGAEVWAKALATPGMPQPGDALSPSYPAALLTGYRFAGANQFKNLVRGELVYTGRIGGDSPITFILTDAANVSHLRTFSSGDGLPLQTWYKTGTAGGVSVDPDPGPGGHHKDFTTNKMVPSGVIRAVGFGTAAQWDAIRVPILLAKGELNSTSWGIYTRAQVYFVGPTTTTTNRGASYTIQMDFVTTDDPAGWMAWGEYFDILGNHPNDSANQFDILAAGLPPVGTQSQHNGITLASLYKETDFNALFSFAP